MTIFNQTLRVGIFLAAVLTSSAKAAPSRPQDLSSLLRQELTKSTERNFQGLLARWKNQHGSKAALPLIALASDSALTDPQRYTAVMAAARLGGKPIATRLIPLLSDPLWMIRFATLKALRALNDPSTGEKVLPLAKDRALVVRNEAILTIRKLRPPGGISAMMESLKDPNNYHGGKAQWVPEKALAGLVELGAGRKVVPDLVAVLLERKDPDLQKRILDVLDQISGRNSSKLRTTKERIAFFKNNPN